MYSRSQNVKTHAGPRQTLVGRSRTGFAFQPHGTCCPNIWRRASIHTRNHYFFQLVFAEYILCTKLSQVLPPLGGENEDTIDAPRTTQSRQQSVGLTAGRKGQVRRVGRIHHYLASGHDLPTLSALSQGYVLRAPPHNAASKGRMQLCKGRSPGRS